jgi:hypothetical protein
MRELTDAESGPKNFTASPTENQTASIVDAVNLSMP